MLENIDQMIFSFGSVGLPMLASPLAEFDIFSLKSCYLVLFATYGCLVFHSLPMRRGKISFITSDSLYER